jgi:3-oxoacid CoA-transferase subunit B
VTELAVLQVTPQGFKLLERAQGVRGTYNRFDRSELIIEGDIPEMVI